MDPINEFVVEPTETHTHTVIMLHGRDSTASDFADEFFESRASDDRTLPQIYPGVRWGFPDAGLLTSSRFDTKMSQWFDMWTTEQPHEKEEIAREGIEAAVPRIIGLIEREAEATPLNHIFLAGISQGSAVAVHALLRGGLDIGGYLGFCSWLPLQDELSKASTAMDVKTPVFLAHSKDDGVIAITYGEQMRDTLRELGVQVTWREYGDGGHWFNEPQGIDDIVAFLGTCGLDAQEKGVGVVA